MRIGIRHPATSLFAATACAVVLAGGQQSPRKVTPQPVARCPDPGCYKLSQVQACDGGL
jgi:hypothetical protein